MTDDSEMGFAVWIAWSRLAVVLRPLRASDLAAVRDLVVAAGMFTADEAAFLDDELGPLIRMPRPGDGDGDGDGDGRTCLVQEAELPVHPAALAGPPAARTVTAVVYYRPEEAADRVWDLTMIAVHPDVQGRGTGRMLMRYAESDLSARGGRLLAVRTSGTPQYAGTRAFYHRCGYDRIAQVPDWWTDGDDLVLFTKRLTARTR
ncbi:GNAT family N-acetyltransferase [Geodermatophilus sp. SYSU D00700]